MKRNRLYIAVSIALLVAAVVGVQVQRAAAGVEVCTPCVVLIEVDGLEPKDVKPDTTPWLWALAHSGDHALTSTNTLQQDQAAIAAAQSPALSSNRNGFAWQAARGVMSASTAAGTTSLLTDLPGRRAHRSELALRQRNGRHDLEALSPRRHQSSRRKSDKRDRAGDFDPARAHHAELGQQGRHVRRRPAASPGGPGPAVGQLAHVAA